MRDVWPVRRFLATGLLVLTTSVAGAAAAAAGPVADRLAGAKEHLMAADYRGDLAQLEAGLAEVQPMLSDPEVGFLAHYWAGFAHWRLAINGANRAMAADDLPRHLDAAGLEFETAIAARADFADAYAAAASVYGWLAMRHRAEPELLRHYAERSNSRLARAVEMAPENPRVLWVQGGSFLFRPRSVGGDPDRALALYERGAQPEAGKAQDRSALPDWGRAENLMSLAFAYLNRERPDPAAARREAQAALALEPDWYYVKEILLPQIDKAAHAAAVATPEVAIERVPGTRVLLRTVIGPYSLHSTVIADLLRTAKSASVEGLVGIYPYDPSVIAESELEWSLAVPMPSDLTLTAAQRDAGYAMRTLPGAEVATIATTVANAAAAGTFLQLWLRQHPWAQAGPTRMCYGSPRAGSPPEQAPVRIEVPVKRLEPAAAADPAPPPPAAQSPS